jgi:hypothetical protein
MASVRKKKKSHPTHWTDESLEEEPSCLEKPAFGCQAGVLSLPSLQEKNSGIIY